MTIVTEKHKRMKGARIGEGLQKDLKLWLGFMALLSCLRILLMLFFHDRMGPHAGAVQIAKALGNGWRFDGQVAFLFIVPALIGSVLGGIFNWKRLEGIVRAVAAAVFVVPTTLLGAINIGFFREFNDQFNVVILGVIYDDMRAILATVWKEYPATWIGVGLVLLDVILVWLLLRLARRPWVGAARLQTLPRWSKIFLTLGCALVCIVVARGSMGSRPLQRKDIAVTADDMLNKCVLNPFRALSYAIQDHLRLARPDGITAILPDGDIRSAVRRLNPGFQQGTDLDASMLRAAKGAAHIPRHVILIIMESYSGWPLFEPYHALGLTPQIERLGAGGVLIRHFLPTGTGTMNSTAPLLMGLPDPGVPANYQPGAKTPLPTGPAVLFKRLGYRTRFFYGGFLSWERLGDFLKDQGYDEVYGGGEMESSGRKNEWGVPDADLFRFALAHLPTDPPSFDVILTVSNHPPFDIDVKGEGFPLTAVPESLKPIWDGGYTLTQMGHLWYSDKCLGAFADAAAAGLPGMLMAATADHYSRRFLNQRPGMPERAFVPFLLYGPGILPPNPAATSLWGSHLDIPPTLVEMAAPAGFAYPAYGRDILDASDGHPSFGAGFSVGRDYLAELGASVWIPWPDVSTAPPAPDLPALSATARDLKAAAWWRVVRGAGLP